MATVTVQIVTYNSADDIESCLEAIKQQKYPIEQVIIIDNHSKDSTVEKIEAWLAKNNHISLRMVKNEENNGFAGAHNQGLNLSKSTYSLILNPDVVLHENYVSEIVKELEQNSAIGSATGKLYRDKRKRILDSTGIIIKKNRRAFDRGANEVDKGQWDEKIDIVGVSGAAAIYRRKMVDDISYKGQFFDEVFFAYKEDVDVAWRGKILGWKASFIPSAIASHKRGWKETKKRKDIPLFVRKHSYINRYYLMLKNDSLLNVIVHFPFIIIYEIIVHLFMLGKERDTLTAWRQFLKNYSYMKIQRQSIQSRRVVHWREVQQYFKGVW